MTIPMCWMLLMHDITMPHLNARIGNRSASVTHCIQRAEQRGERIEVEKLKCIYFWNTIKVNANICGMPSAKDSIRYSANSMRTY